MFQPPFMPPLRTANQEEVAEGELDGLGAVAGLLADRSGDVDDDRSDWRLPLQGQAGGGAKLLGIPGVVVREDVPDVEEGGESHRVGGCAEGRRKDDLGRGGGQEGPTDRLGNVGG